MPLYKNNQPSSISINNSFSSRVSGDFINFEKGLIYSNTGTPFLKSGEMVDNQEYLLKIKLNGFLIASGANLSTEDDFEDKYNHSFFVKPNSRSESYLNGDFFLFKNSGENPIFNCLLSKISGSTVLSVANGLINNNPITESIEPFYKIEIDPEQKGQLIFYANYDSENPDSFSFGFLESLSFSDQPSFQRDNLSENENWDTSSEFVFKTPICLVDLDRESVTNFFNQGVSISKNSSSFGVDGRGYPTLL